MNELELLQTTIDLMSQRIDILEERYEKLFDFCITQAEAANNTTNGLTNLTDIVTGILERENK